MNPNIVNQNFKQNFFSKRRIEKEKISFWITFTYMMLLWLIVILLLYYIWSLNANATKWYTLRDLEKTKKELLMEKEILDVKLAELESMNFIENNYNMKNMEKIENPDHVVIKENTQYVYNY